MPVSLLCCETTFTCSCSSKWPKNPLCLSYLDHRVCLLNNRADRRRPVLLLRCQRGSTRLFRAGPISTNSAPSICPFRADQISSTSVCDVSAAVHGFSALILFGRICSNDQPSRSLQTWLLALLRSPSFLWHVCSTDHPLILEESSSLTYSWRLLLFISLLHGP